MPGTLYIVATPIGNLEDITLRALRVLREVAVIAAEDTRRTGRLLAHYGIPTKTLSFHEHNARSRVPQFIARLRDGEGVAVVSDAGTPGISDPGFELVRACIQAGVPVDPVPGASAVITALVASGFAAAPATFWGFPPRRSQARNMWLNRVSSDQSTAVLFESPHRISQLLNELANLSVNRPIFLARELTKAHQEFLRGTPRDLIPKVEKPRGEFTVVLAPVDMAHETTKGAQPQVAASQIAQEFRHMTECALIGRRSAISRLAKRHGCTAREIYSLIEKAKYSGL